MMLGWRNRSLAWGQPAVYYPPYLSRKCRIAPVTIVDIYTSTEIANAVENLFFTLQSGYKKNSTRRVEHHYRCSQHYSWCDFTTKDHALHDFQKIGEVVNVFCCDCCWCWVVSDVGIPLGVYHAIRKKYGFFTNAEKRV